MHKRNFELTTFQNKYAPKHFDDLVFANSYSQQRLKDFAENKRHNSVILHGPYGTAKSTTARILAQSRTGDSADVFHASEITIKSFDGMLGRQNLQRSMHGVELPVSVIDEIDQIDERLQFRLRRELDRDPAMGCFVFTTNKLHVVDPGLKDRCCVVEMPAIDSELWFERSKWILTQEGIVVPDDKLRSLVKTCDGSIRDLMRALEDATLMHAQAA